ncbi:methyltransferase domain-containing protein [Candidatus Woesearchaeota archaeon]|nr:methyltransferase domain-containing protein [Candidatus Woesearchaeota archaeon]
MTNYYDGIAKGYDGLYEEEQQAKMDKIVKEYKVEKDFQLLDVGCGTGISTSRWDCETTGVDPSQELIRIAREKYPEKDFMVGKAESLPFPDKSFDVVTCITAIHNFENPLKGIQEMKRVGKGVFVITLLRKSKKVEEIQKLILNNFIIKRIVMEDKDIIFICEKARELNSKPDKKEE